MFRTKGSPWDLIAVGIVLLVAIALFCVPLTAKSGAYLEVTTPQGSTLYALSEAREIEVTSNGVTLRILIENGEARVWESSCPDGVCVASGRISRAGQTVLCAPAGVLLTVKGGDGHVDFVAG